MSGFRVSQFTTRNIRYDIEGRCEHASARLLKHRTQVAIDAGKHLPGIVCFMRELLNQRTQHRGDECGTDAVAHHITNENSSLRVRQCEHSKEIAAECLGR